MEYFEELQQDWDRLGLGRDSYIPRRLLPSRDVTPIGVETYDDLHNLMINSTLRTLAIRESSRYSDRVRDIPAQELQTEFGRRMLSLCLLPCDARTIDRWMCPDSEPNIALSLDPANISNENFPSPVIVTRENLAIGAIKRLGERSYFALRDDETTGTHAGQVYRTPLSNWARPFEATSKLPHASQIDVDTVHDLIGSTRMTFYAIPTSARTGIKVPNFRKNYNHSLATSHDELVESVDSALENAVPTGLGSRYTPESTK